MQIVLVDPSRVVIHSLTEMLVARGHRVTAHVDSRAALDHVARNPEVSCVLTSLEVQPLDGLELCWSLRALAGHRRPLSILVMSSSREGRFLDEILDSGADDFLSKPPVPRELYARLRAAERMLALQAALIRQADTDHLSQIYNRGAFLDRLDRMVAGRSEVPFSLLLLDIDSFKAINDRHGHPIGDAVIRAVAGILGDTGLVTGRIGGEEFGLLVPLDGLDRVHAVARDLRERCAAHSVATIGGIVRFTVSIGVSTCVPGEAAALLIERADRALYAAKAGGRDRVAIATAGTDVLAMA